MRTDFVLDALEQALYARQLERNASLIHHSDRGSPYVSIRYTARLAQAGIEPSVGSKGDSYDNVLLEYLARNAGRVVSKTMIMERVWDYNFDPQTNIVESRICRLRDKVDKDFNTPLIHTVRGVGYVLKEDLP